MSMNTAELLAARAARPACDDARDTAPRHAGRAVVMGILNVTPDSFSDGGRYLDAASAVARAEAMLAQGADIIDIGAESTRPGSEAVAPDEQIRRLRDCLPAICRLGAPVSIDTTSAAVARFALESGAALVNDIAAGRDDPALLALAAEYGAHLVLMHMQGAPRTMQADPVYADVVAEVRDFLLERVAAAEAAGVPRHRCLIDPGIGFGKTLEHNLALLAATDEFVATGLPVLIGVSRKRFIAGACGDCPPESRLGGSLAAACRAYLDGAAVFRVHDVAETRQALDLLAAIGA